MANDPPQNTINLDLNLGPVLHPAQNNEPQTMNIQDWLKPSVIEKTNEDEGSFFDCNICLDLANDPVVTCCGHLFCWPCLYRWLHMHNDITECPICKGEVSTKTVTPIYSRVNVNQTCVTEPDSSVKIPCRPKANRVENWRRLIQRNTFNNIPMFEMIRRLETNPREIRSDSLLNVFLTSRGMRVEQERTEPGSVDSVGSTLLSRGSNRGATGLNHTSGLSSEERLVNSYLLDRPVDWNQEELPLMDDQDSFSSIVAIIQSESQTGDATVEIDSRVSDVNTGDSRT